jgi:AcrR family transcriptional regulator
LKTRARSQSRRTAAPQKHAAYHHGDLPAALLESAERLVEKNGIEGFTLRESAREAGVSHGAPAHHFGSKTGLLAELAAHAARERQVDAEAWLAQAGPDPVDRLENLGLAYIQYALLHPQLHRLMFAYHAQDAVTPCVDRLGDSLTDCVEAVLGRPLIPDKRANPETILPWALVHGIAALINEGILLHDVPEAARARAALELSRQVLALLRPLFALQRQAASGR